MEINQLEIFKKHQTSDIAQIATIMGEEILLEANKRMERPWIEVAMIVGSYAIDFFELHRHTNWDNEIEKGLTPVSEHYKKELSDLSNWNEIVLDYAWNRLEMEDLG